MRDFTIKSEKKSKTQVEVEGKRIIYNPYSLDVSKNEARSEAGPSERIFNLLALFGMAVVALLYGYKYLNSDAENPYKNSQAWVTQIEPKLKEARQLCENAPAMVGNTDAGKEFGRKVTEIKDLMRELGLDPEKVALKCNVPEGRNVFEVGFK